jgi:ubiquinone/menaquinone biosynthesis C-methylase UbiE
MVFDEKNATADELWDYCLAEYRNANPVVRFLLERFFRKLRWVVSGFDDPCAILEVGCGAGESSRRILQMLSPTQRFEVSEYDERYVTKMRQTGFPLKATVESVYEMRRQADEFDYILLLEVLEHLDDPHRALREVFRVARKAVVVSVPFEPVWRLMNCVRLKYLKAWGNTPGHLHHWSPWGLRRLLARYGDVRAVHVSLPWVIAFAAKRPVAAAAG